MRDDDGNPKMMTPDIRQNNALTWAAGRKFLYLSCVTIHENRPPCDACGSNLVRNFKLIENLGNHYLIGSDCFNLLYDKDQIISDARMSWQGTPFWRDLAAIEQKVIAEKGAGPDLRDEPIESKAEEYKPEEKQEFPMKNLGHFFSACFTKYNMRPAEVLKELGVGSKGDIADVAQAWQKVQMAKGEK